MSLRVTLISLVPTVLVVALAWPPSAAQAFLLGTLLGVGVVLGLAAAGWRW